MRPLATGTTVGWQMVSTGEPCELRDYAGPELEGDRVRVRVAGCGLCHTDLGFLSGAVEPQHGLPLTLGHEVAGVIEEVGPDCALAPGTRVIVPAVLPCGECALCERQRENACQRQLMPGNHLHGGFASHMTVPGRYLVPVGELPADHELEDLAVVADAVSTPYQAVQRAGVGEGELAVVIGVGGIGGFGVQIASAFGALVAALDIDDDKLDRLSGYGADFTLNVAGQGARQVRKELRELARSAELPATGWKIFEMSGTRQGQELAFGLLNHTATLAIVGFTMDKLEVRLSNLMAFDATAFGTWGSRPACYPEVLELVRAGRIAIKPFVRRYPMSALNELVAEAHRGALKERPVLIPDF